MSPLEVASIKDSKLGVLASQLLQSARFGTNTFDRPATIVARFNRALDLLAELVAGDLCLSAPTASEFGMVPGGIAGCDPLRNFLYLLCKVLWTDM